MRGDPTPAGIGVPDRVRAALAGLDRPVCAFVYDTEVLAATAAALRCALPDATVLYAVKANGHPDVVRVLAGAVHGLEVASGGELALALTAGARRIAFGGPAKTDAELAAAVAASRAGVRLTINVESAGELRRLALLTGDGARIRVALRVNRAAAGPAGSHTMTGAPTPFGIDETQLDAVAAAALAIPGIDVVGFHLHAVSNNLDGSAHAAFIRDAMKWSIRAAGRTGIALREVNVGGGLGVDYTGDAAFDLAALAGPAPPDGVDLVLEPGRFLAAPAGWYAAEVLDLKRTHGRWFAVLRGGTHHFRLPAAWGYSHPFAVLERDDWPYPFARPEVRDTDVDAVGELCTPRDVLARDRRVSRLRVGDVLVFGRTGGYGWDISHHEFLRHPYPDMIVI
jgi:diaminopimelate decarboxylase